MATYQEQITRNQLQKNAERAFDDLMQAIADGVSRTVVSGTLTLGQGKTVMDSIIQAMSDMTERQP